MTAYVEVQAHEVRQVLEVAKHEFKQAEAAQTVEILGTPAVHGVSPETLAVCTIAWCGAIPVRRSGA